MKFTKDQCDSIGEAMDDLQNAEEILLGVGLHAFALEVEELREKIIAKVNSHPTGKDAGQ